MAAGLYIHVPFCRRKCPYCNFYSIAAEPEQLEAYTQAVCRNLRHYARQETVDTVYFGGGTPSLLSPAQIGQILETAGACFSLSADAEVTLEANPATVTTAQLRQLRNSGVNRLSFGVQSLSDSQLKRLGRLHTAQEAIETVTAAASAGFDNLSYDLMLALPGQTPEKLEVTIRQLTQLPIVHVSAYLLKIEPGTAFAQQHIAAQCPDEDTAADLYLQTVEQLGAAGFAQYEISNFAKPGHESRHNLRYWLTRPYIGFGPGAHSDFGGRRYSFVRDLDAYIKGVLEGGNILDSEELIPRQERCGEYLMLRLRTALGIEEWEYRRNYFMDFAPLERRLEEFQAQGWAENTAEGRWRFTPKGFLVSNQLIGDLLDRQEQAQLSDGLVRAREHYAARGPEEG